MLTELLQLNILTCCCCCCLLNLPSGSIGVRKGLLHLHLMDLLLLQVLAKFCPAALPPSSLVPRDPLLVSPSTSWLKVVCFLH